MRGLNPDLFQVGLKMIVFDHFTAETISHYDALGFLNTSSHDTMFSLHD